MKTEQVYIDLVRKYFPKVSVDEAESILWDNTPFPMRHDIQEIESYLAAYNNLVSDSLVYGPAKVEINNSLRFAEFLDGLSEDQYINFEENIKGDLQKYE